LRSNRTENAAFAAAQFESLGNLLSRHRAITRVSLAALSFTILVTISQQSPAQAGPEPAPLVPDSLLPQSIGIAVTTDASVTIPFGAPMDPASVQAALQVIPDQDVALAWNADLSALTVRPGRLWRTDERYIVVIGGDARTSAGVGLSAARRFTFTTQTAPAVADFQVRLAGPDITPPQPEAASTELSTRSVALEADPAADAARVADAEPIGAGALSQPPTQTASAVSATTSVSVGFSAPMDRPDVEEHFAITPHVAGDLAWRGTNLVFTPTERLVAGSRYTISVVGAHDVGGNVLGGKGNFSFTVRAGAQVTKTTPRYNETGVEPAAVDMWFSQAVDVEATTAAFTLVDASDHSPVAGTLAWNDAHTQLTFTPSATLTAGRTYSVVLGTGARDADGNPIGVTWSFRTKAPPPPPPAPVRATVTVRSAPSVPPPAPATTLAGYALNQVNAARAAYGFAPLVLDASISAVAYAHAYDQAINGYFSHYGLDGSTREQRLTRGGVSFGWSGENQCYLVGRSQQATLDWCHAQFMAEPYPGYWNHIANILNPNARRMGVGIATVGGKTVITWDFTD
jgi:uncharacterized protein YkwD